ncbi:MAG: ROK family protein [Acidimicrobiales bacterium]|nr:ROK family protein [Acidimicrobiales bacterium]
MPARAVPTAGLDVGGTKCLGVLLDADDRVLVERRVPTPPGIDALLDALAELVEALTAGGGPAGAVGVGLPGLVDGSGCLRFAAHLPGVVDVPFTALLGQRLGVPVVTENDATCATAAEWRLGAGRGVDDLVLVTLGTGIGAGLVAGGAVQIGAHGFAGEPGHMVVQADGPPCDCGGRGHWEVFASGRGLGRLGRDAAEAGRADAVLAAAGGEPDAIRGEHVVAAARAGDAGAAAVIDRFSWWIALGLANLADVLDPALFVLGGGLVADADLLLDPVRAHFHGHVMAQTHRPEAPIVAATLGERAGAIGAATEARRALSP